MPEIWIHTGIVIALLLACLILRGFAKTREDNYQARVRQLRGQGYSAKQVARIMGKKKRLCRKKGDCDEQGRNESGGDFDKV